MLYAYEPFDLMVMQTVELMDENDKLKLENAKLRELVHTIWLAGDFRAFLGVGELEVRMRDLGIEVKV